MRLISATRNRDFEIIQKLAVRIWNDHYIPIIGQEQVDYMLTQMYDLDSLCQQNSAGHLFYLVADSEDYLGFASIKETAESQWFLNKLYVDSQKQRGGIGSYMLNEMMKLHPIKELRLQVNRKNFKAINFYFKQGFKIERVADFDIGNGYYMNDFVMVKSN